jgi:uncharacterized membrane protein
MSVEAVYPKKKKNVAIALWFIGIFGVLNLHNFYLGKFLIGLIKLLAFFGVAALANLFFPFPQSKYVLLSFNMFYFIWNIIELVHIIKLDGEMFGKSLNTNVSKEDSSKWIVCIIPIIGILLLMAAFSGSSNSAYKKSMGWLGILGGILLIMGILLVISAIQEKFKKNHRG